MDIALQTNIIVIRTSRKSLSKPWISRFLDNYKEELLFLSHSVIIYDNEEQEEEKRHFLTKACELFAEKESLDAGFFVRAIMSCLSYPIKIQTTDDVNLSKKIDVEVKALSNNQVSMFLQEPDLWFSIYMQSKLYQAVVKVSSSELVFDLTTQRLRQTFERSLNRNCIFSRKVNYHYAGDFLRTLFCSDVKNAHHDKYYAVLGCQQNASKDELKNSYKQLAKTYHPDQVIHLNDQGKIGHFTRKFQQVQEAYQALKGA